jgi:hypothetical protein
MGRGHCNDFQTIFAKTYRKIAFLLKIIVGEKNDQNIVARVEQCLTLYICSTNTCSSLHLAREEQCTTL